MAKEFKNWDKAFNKKELTETREYFLRGSTSTILSEIKRWDCVVGTWMQEFVQYCVYKASDVRSWQHFRVSMKGCTTQEKLYMLKAWYVKMCYFDSVEMTPEQRVEWKINKCRIDNYIGALVRGGQLSSDGNYAILK